MNRVTIFSYRYFASLEEIYSLTKRHETHAFSRITGEGANPVAPCALYTYILSLLCGKEWHDTFSDGGAHLTSTLNTGMMPTIEPKKDAALSCSTGSSSEPCEVGEWIGWSKDIAHFFGVDFSYSLSHYSIYFGWSHSAFWFFFLLFWLNILHTNRWEHIFWFDIWSLAQKARL